MTSEDNPFDRYALPPLLPRNDEPDDGIEDAQAGHFELADGIEGAEPGHFEAEDDIEDDEYVEAQEDVEYVEADEDDEYDADFEADEVEVEADDPEPEPAYFAVGYDEGPIARRTRGRSPLARASQAVDAVDAAEVAALNSTELAGSDETSDAVVFAAALSANDIESDEDEFQAQDEQDEQDEFQAQDEQNEDALAFVASPSIPGRANADEIVDEMLPDFLRNDALEAAFGIRPSQDEHMTLLDPEPRPPMRDLPPERAAPPRANPTVARTLAEIPVLIVVAALIAFLVKTFLAQAYYIPSGSMLPQLQIDDRVVVSKLSYKLHDPHRGDIVVFDDPRPQASSGTTNQDTGFQKWVRKIGEGVGVVQPSTDEFIKRVIGLPGDKVSGHDGAVYINGHKLIEPYLPVGVETSDFPAQTVASGKLWVMGDNRGGSADSRVFGQIRISTIVGRAMVKVWPFSHASFL